jgi:hypothetical protein
MLTNIVYSSLISAYLIALISKINLRNLIIERVPSKLISELFSCDFCLSFWVNLLISIMITIYTKDIRNLLICIFATPITRILL